MPTLTAATSFSEINNVRIPAAKLGAPTENKNAMSRRIKFDLFHLLAGINQLFRRDVHALGILFSSFAEP